jgi:hypothetical protein
LHLTQHGEKANNYRSGGASMRKDALGVTNVPFATGVLVLSAGAAVVGVLRTDIPLEIPASPKMILMDICPDAAHYR